MTTERRGRYSVLLIEDDPDHATLMIRALAGMEVAWVRDGATALERLRQEGLGHAAAATRRPDLVLLDVNLPRVSGHDVLRAIKADPALRTIPVIMLTTAGDDEIVRTSYALGANSFIPKPASFTEFTAKLRQLSQYWMVTNVSL